MTKRRKSSGGKRRKSAGKRRKSAGKRRSIGRRRLSGGRRKISVAAKDRMLMTGVTSSTPGVHGPKGTWYPVGHSKYKKVREANLRAKRRAVEWVMKLPTRKWS